MDMTSPWSAAYVASTLAMWITMMTAMMLPSATPMFRVVLIGAGLYQFTPLKVGCLLRCRSPFSLLLRGWRDGTAGALRMGVEQGTYCVACCWPLMLVLFVVGIMNPLWIVLLGTLVVLEQLATGERWPRQALGGRLVAWGALVLAGRL